MLCLSHCSHNVIMVVLLSHGGQQLTWSTKSLHGEIMPVFMGRAEVILVSCHVLEWTVLQTSLSAKPKLVKSESGPMSQCTQISFDMEQNLFRSQIA